MMDAREAVPEPRYRVAVVGGGMSGIVTARVLTEIGCEVVVFERADDIGGVWSASRAYPGIATQDDRRSYAFSDAPMPEGVAAHPAGDDVRTHLEAYVRRHGLEPSLRLATVVRQATPVNDAGWEVESVGSAGPVVERFDWLVAAHGVFSVPHVPVWPGREQFEAAGGRVVVPSAVGDGSVLDGSRTVVIGWGKTACDIAVAASSRSADTRLVARRLTWKYPKRLGFGRLTFHHLVLTRAGERLLATNYRDATGRLLLRRVPERLPRVLLDRILARAVDRATGFSRSGLRSTFEFRNSTSLLTDGFIEAVEGGRLAVHREQSVAELGADEDGPFVRLTDGSRLRADVLVPATGYEQGVGFLSDDALQRLREAGGLLLHRRILAIDLPRLAFIGCSHSYRSPLTAEVSAVWLASVLRGRVRLSTPARRRAGAVLYPLGPDLAGGAHTAALPPVTLRQLDGLLSEVGAPLPLRTRIRQIWHPTDPADYAAALQRALQPDARSRRSRRVDSGFFESLDDPANRSTNRIS